MDVVDPAYGGPEFVAAEIGQWKGGLLARVGVRPIISANDLAGMGCVFERVVVGIERAADDGGNFAVD